MRQITISCAGNSAVADSYNAGYQGEHNATQLLWQLPEDLQNYNYILAFALPDGNTESVVIDEYPIVYSLSQTITQLAGVINVQLTILNDDEIIYKTQQVQLRIASSVSIDNTAKPYTSELTQAIEQFIAATKSLSKITVASERKDSSVDISITDQNGNTEVFSIFDGSDYVLTDDDKQEIARLIGTHAVKTALDAELKANTEYYIGTQTAVKLVYPQSGNAGDSIYVNFTGASSGASLTAKNCVGLADFQPQSGYVCEIHAQYDGSRWVCLTAQTETAV